MRIVHYINQFFAGIGGEEAADTPPRFHEGSVGPGRPLAQLLGPTHEIVATVVCGDDYAVSAANAPDEIDQLVRRVDADLLIAGPAFTSGRYGLASARVARRAQESGLPALAAMHPDNPGVPEAGLAAVVATGETARQMKAAVAAIADAATRLLEGQPFGRAEGRIGRIARRGVLLERPGAERAVDLLLRRLVDGEIQTEVKLPAFDAVIPASAVADPAQATIALLTEGGLVPAGNPDGLESSRATRWLRYPLTMGEDGKLESVDGGYDTAAVNADPNRLVPADVARELEAEGRIGKLHDEYLVTTGNGMSVAEARRIGVEWAGELHSQNVQAAILTAT